MKVSAKVEYALRLMADIARYGHGGQVVPLKDVARRQQLSKLYLAQLTIPLKHAELLKSVWGNKGGFLLARAPAKINLLDIVEAVDGPVSVLDCLHDPGVCKRSKGCECIGVWRDVNSGIVNALAARTLEDVVSRRPRKGSQNVSLSTKPTLH